MKNSERVRIAAKHAEIYLRDKGQHGHAEAIRKLIASHGSSNRALKQLHADNMKLRKELAR